MKDQVILHCDCNNYFASVESIYRPELRGVPMAVCGDPASRHGIILAKNEEAKKYGIKTAETIYQALKKCPNLTLIRPTRYLYGEYCRRINAIYAQYTDQVEAFSIDESWLDVTGSQNLFGTGEQIANELRRRVREELGLSISVGVSFNKIFAKLGSDMKKPDGTTVIGEDFRETVWPLPARELLYVGPATERKLAAHGICTIGQIAQADPEFLRRLLGVHGLSLHSYANGRDCSAVMPYGYRAPVQSIGHGVTCRSDLTGNEEMFRILLELSQDIGRKLRSYHLLAGGVQIGVRDSHLATRQYQRTLEIPTADALELARAGEGLLAQRWTGGAVRALTITAIDLCEESRAQQLTLFDDSARRDRRKRLNRTLDELENRFGRRAVYPSSLLLNEKMPRDGRNDVKLPGLMYR